LRTKAEKLGHVFDHLPQSGGKGPRAAGSADLARRAGGADQANGADPANPPKSPKVQ
jgi:hypothetical protein